MNILGPILFNLFINDLRRKKSEVILKLSDTAKYSCSLNCEEAYRNLSTDTHILCMIASRGKFQAMFLRSSINIRHIYSRK